MAIFETRKGQNVQSLTKEFRKKTLALIIPLDSLETVMKYIGALHSYLGNFLLLFEPSTIDAYSMKAIHLESRGKHDWEYRPKKSPSKP